MGDDARVNIAIIFLKDLFGLLVYKKDIRALFLNIMAKLRITPASDFVYFVKPIHAQRLYYVKIHSMQIIFSCPDTIHHMLSMEYDGLKSLDE